MTAVGNDYGFDEIYERQVNALGQPGDVLVAISTSGNSPNVVRAMEAASAREMHVLALTGKGGGVMGNSLRPWTSIYACPVIARCASRKSTSCCCTPFVTALTLFC